MRGIPALPPVLPTARFLARPTACQLRCEARLRNRVGRGERLSICLCVACVARTPGARLAVCTGRTPRQHQLRADPNRDPESQSTGAGAPLECCRADGMVT